MEQEKINNNYYDASTAESDHDSPPEIPTESSSATAGRSYDCTFCKRGFTNAQALGGHMNIHRKDKEKAKSKKKKNREEDDPMIQSFDLSFFPRIAAASYGQAIERERRHVNYEVYMPPPNPSLQIGKKYEYCFFPVWRPNNVEDRVGGDSRFDEDGEENVDLELRLG